MGRTAEQLAADILQSIERCQKDASALGSEDLVTMAEDALERNLQIIGGAANQGRSPVNASGDSMMLRATRLRDGMTVIVRAPRAGDERALGPLHNLVWRVAYAGLLPVDYLRRRDDDVATRRWAGILAGLDDQGHGPDGQVVRVAEVDERLVGFLTVGPAGDPDMGDRLELQALYVHPELHGTGVAQALVVAGLPDGPSYLWVLDGNLRAQAFYRKLGYHLDGTSKTHEPSGGTEIRMTRG